MQKGQTLLELIIALGLLIIIATAITVSTSSGLKNSLFSSNQAQATKYAQEGLEKVKLIKTRNSPICLKPPASPACINWSDLWPDPPYLPITMSLSDNPFIFETNPAVCGAGITLCLKYSATPEKIDANFSRQIFVLDVLDSAIQKKIIARVTWTDSSGPHNSELVTVLAKF